MTIFILVGCIVETQNAGLKSCVNIFNKLNIRSTIFRHKNNFMFVYSTIHTFDRNASHKEKSLRCYRSSRYFSPSLLRSNDRDLLVNLSGGELCASHFGEHEDLQNAPINFHVPPHSRSCFAETFGFAPASAPCVGTS
jgi:hypothetical protein